MADVDLNTFEFDYSLTFSVLLMNAFDRTIYHRFGTRSSESATAWTSINFFETLLKETLEEHKNHVISNVDSGTRPLPKKTARDYPELDKITKSGNDRWSCIHCHQINEVHINEYKNDGKWSSNNMVWETVIWPNPNRMGIELDPEDQNKITNVISNSPAALAGLEKGDRILKMNTIKVRTISDIQWILFKTPEADSVKAQTIDIQYEKNGKITSCMIRFLSPWKAGDPSEVWQDHLHWLSPQPGFWTKPLTNKEIQKLNLKNVPAGYKVESIQNNDRFGDNAKKAGIKKGDIILSADGKKDFKSSVHFQSWFVLTRKPGNTVNIEIIRNTNRLNIQLPVIE
ncbi:MAG: PDZ domain-containing protein [Planctomycetes bacterium]|nr:PDZ domain-containing protein [Planctomycetota bacterium]